MAFNGLGLSHKDVEALAVDDGGSSTVSRQREGALLERGRGYYLVETSNTLQRGKETDSRPGRAT